MTRTTVERTISAPMAAVFQVIDEIGRYPEIFPDVASIEFLSEQRSGPGTRFREIGLVKDKPSVTELDITEYVEDEMIRMVADSHGTVWDSVFRVSSQGQSTRLVLTMDARAHRLLPKILNPLLKGLYKKGLHKHLDVIKAHCERIGRVK